MRERDIGVFHRHGLAVRQDHPQATGHALTSDPRLLMLDQPSLDLASAVVGSL
jgi:ABC-type branched-subunit amino acid transport system ATPase component